jgi:hypothetical protein
MAQEKTEFRNATDGTIGVVVVEPGGKRQAIPLVAGASVWLSEEDQIATANAPASDEDNPFINGQLERVSNPEGVKNRRPIGVVQETEAEVRQRSEAEAKAKAATAERRKESEAQQKEEQERLETGREQAQRGGARPQTPPPRQSPDETGAPPQPQGKAAEGSRAAGEEVATPEAASAS